MTIRYKNNDATQIPVYMSGTCIQIRQWLRGEQYVPFLKSVFAYTAQDDGEYDDGQGRKYDILDEELQ